MNWVGGVRKRVNQQNERKRQQEFFERQKYLKKVENARGGKRISGRSSDLLSLLMTQKTNAPADSNAKIKKEKAKPLSLDLDRALSFRGGATARAAGAQGRQRDLDIGPISPPSVQKKSSPLDAHIDKCRNFLQRERENKPTPSSTLLLPSLNSTSTDTTGDLSTSSLYPVSSSIVRGGLVSRLDEKNSNEIVTKEKSQRAYNDGQNATVTEQTPFLQLNKPPSSVKFSSKITFLRTPSPDEAAKASDQTRPFLTETKNKTTTNNSTKENKPNEAPAKNDQKEKPFWEVINRKRKPFWEDDTPALQQNAAVHPEQNPDRFALPYMFPLSSVNAAKTSNKPSLSTIAESPIRNANPASFKKSEWAEFLERKHNERKDDRQENASLHHWRKRKFAMAVEDFQETPLKHYVTKHKHAENKPSKHDKHEKEGFDVKGGRRKSKMKDVQEPVQRHKEPAVTKYKDLESVCDDGPFNKVNARVGWHKFMTPRDPDEEEEEETPLDIRNKLSQNPTKEKPVQPSLGNWKAASKANGRPYQFDDSSRKRQRTDEAFSRGGGQNVKTGITPICDDKIYNETHARKGWRDFITPKAPAAMGKAPENGMGSSDLNAKDGDKIMDQYCDDSFFNKAHPRVGWDKFITPHQKRVTNLAVLEESETPLVSQESLINQIDPVAHVEDLDEENETPLKSSALLRNSKAFSNVSITSVRDENPIPRPKRLFSEEPLQGGTVEKSRSEALANFEKLCRPCLPKKAKESKEQEKKQQGTFMNQFGSAYSNFTETPYPTALKTLKEQSCLLETPILKTSQPKSVWDSIKSLSETLRPPKRPKPAVESPNESASGFESREIASACRARFKKTIPSAPLDPSSSETDPCLTTPKPARRNNEFNPLTSTPLFKWMMAPSSVRIRNQDRTPLINLTDTTANPPTKTTIYKPKSDTPAETSKPPVTTVSQSCQTEPLENILPFMGQLAVKRNNKEVEIDDDNTVSSTDSETASGHEKEEVPVSNLEVKNYSENQLGGDLNVQGNESHSERSKIVNIDETKSESVNKISQNRFDGSIECIVDNLEVESKGNISKDSQQTQKKKNTEANAYNDNRSPAKRPKEHEGNTIAECRSLSIPADDHASASTLLSSDQMDCTSSAAAGSIETSLQTNKTTDISSSEANQTDDIHSAHNTGEDINVSAKLTDDDDSKTNTDKDINSKAKPAEDIKFKATPTAYTNSVSTESEDIIHKVKSNNPTNSAINIRSPEAIDADANSLEEAGDDKDFALKSSGYNESAEDTLVTSNTNDTNAVENPNDKYMEDTQSCFKEQHKLPSSSTNKEFIEKLLDLKNDAAKMNMTENVNLREELNSIFQGVRRCDDNCLYSSEDGVSKENKTYLDPPEKSPEPLMQNPVDTKPNMEHIEQNPDTEQITPKLDTIEENPEQVEQNSDTIRENHEHMEHNPDTVEEHPETVKENSEYIKQNPDAVEENPEQNQDVVKENLEQNADTTDENPEQSNENPEQIKHNPDAVEDIPKQNSDAGRDNLKLNLNTADEYLEQIKQKADAVEINKTPTLPFIEMDERHPQMEENLNTLKENLDQINQNPEQVKQNPDTVEENPEQIKQNRDAVEGNPKQKPVSVEENPEYIKQTPASVEENLEQNLVLVEGNPEQIKQKQDAAEENLAQINQNSDEHVVKENPEQIKPDATGKIPEQIRQKLDAVEGVLETIKQNQDTIEDNPAQNQDTIEPDPKEIIQNADTAKENPDRVTEANQEVVKQNPDTIEADLEEIKQSSDEVVESPKQIEQNPHTTVQNEEEIEENPNQIKFTAEEIKRIPEQDEPNCEKQSEYPTEQTKRIPSPNAKDQDRRKEKPKATQQINKSDERHLELVMQNSVAVDHILNDQIDQINSIAAGIDDLEPTVIPDSQEEIAECPPNDVYQQSTTSSFTQSKELLLPNYQSCCEEAMDLTTNSSQRADQPVIEPIDYSQKRIPQSQEPVPQCDTPISQLKERMPKSDQTAAQSQEITHQHDQSKPLSHRLTSQSVASVLIYRTEPTSKSQQPKPRSHERAAQSQKPQAHVPAPETKEPAPQDEEQIYNSGEPVADANEPISQSQEPTPKSSEQAPKSQDPTPKSSESAPQSQEPTPISQERKPQSQEPTSKSPKPEPLFQEPTLKSQELKPQSQEPTPKSQEPKPQSHDPTHVAIKPAPTDIKPVLQYQELQPREQSRELAPEAKVPESHEPVPQSQESLPQYEKLTSPSQELILQPNDSAPQSEKQTPQNQESRNRKSPIKETSINESDEPDHNSGKSLESDINNEGILVAKPQNINPQFDNDVNVEVKQDMDKRYKESVSVYKIQINPSSTRSSNRRSKRIMNEIEKCSQ